MASGDVNLNFDSIENKNKNNSEKNYKFNF